MSCKKKKKLMTTVVFSNALMHELPALMVSSPRLDREAAILLRSCGMKNRTRRWYSPGSDSKLRMNSMVRRKMSLASISSASSHVSDSSPMCFSVPINQQKIRLVTRSQCLRKTVVSLEAQTPTNQPKITVPHFFLKIKKLKLIKNCR